MSRASGHGNGPSCGLSRYSPTCPSPRPGTTSPSTVRRARNPDQIHVPHTAHENWMSSFHRAGAVPAEKRPAPRTQWTNVLELTHQATKALRDLPSDPGHVNSISRPCATERRPGRPSLIRPRSPSRAARARSAGRTGLRRSHCGTPRAPNFRLEPRYAIHAAAGSATTGSLDSRGQRVRTDVGLSRDNEDSSARR